MKESLLFLFVFFAQYVFCQDIDYSEIPRFNYENFEINKGRFGEIKIGMTISEAETKFDGLRKEINEAANLGYGGGSPAYLYYDKDNLVFGLIPALDRDSILLIIAVSPKLTTINGLTPNSTAEEISDLYPKIKVYQNLMNNWEEMSDITNNWDFIFVTEEKTIGIYPELEMPSEVINSNIKSDWITIK